MDLNPIGEFSALISDSLFDISIDTTTSDLIKKITMIALIIAGTNFFLTMAYNYLKSSFEAITSMDETKFPDWNMLGRTIVLCIAVTIYLPIAQTITTTITGINDLTRMSESNQTKLASMVEKYNDSTVANYDDHIEASRENAEEYAEELGISENQAKSIPPDKNVDDGMLGTLKKIQNLLDPLTLMTLGFQAVVGIILSIIRFIILGVMCIVFKVLLIFGPLAFAFSVLPIFEKQASIWFGTICNVGLTFTTLNILDHIMYSIFSSIIESVPKYAYSSVTTGYSVVIITLYLMCFWLTSKFCGKSDAGRVLSKMVGIGTSAAMLVGAAATMGAGAPAAGGSTGGGALSGAVSAGSNAIESNKK